MSKAYLTYGWWLENPNNIPTYPECDRTDPDGHDAAWYYQQAYDIATEAIDNPGPYGLMEVSTKLMPVHTIVTKKFCYMQITRKKMNITMVVA